MNKAASSLTSVPTQNWASYERPAVMQEFVRQEDDGTLVADLLIQGVTCAACTWTIETTLRQIPGVVSIEVNPVTTRAQLRWNPEQANLADLLRAIAELKYRPIPFTNKATQDAAEQHRRVALRRLLVAGLGMMQVTSYAVAMYAGAFQGMDPEIEYFLRLISLLVATPIVIYSGAPFFEGAWHSIRRLRPGMDLPVALAIGGAWLASVWNTYTGVGEVYFDSATMFVFFLSGTRYLEAAGRHRALDLTHALAQQLPCTALRVTSTGQEEVGVVELETNDLVLVPAGVAFPADGILLSESARVDESMITGESMAVSRQRGDSVVAGTLNTADAVKITVRKTGQDTVLAHIGRLVTQAGQERPQLVELTDRIASVFVAGIILIAIITGLVWWHIEPGRAFEIVLSVLVVTCPCALAIATPAAFTVATSRLARDGFLVRRAGALQRLAGIQHIIFDKTGTLTDNQLHLESVVCRDDVSEDFALGVAAALEAESAHPIARAFRNHQPAEQGAKVTAIAGGGLLGEIGGQKYRIGNLDFACGAVTASSETNSALVKANDNRQIYLADETGLVARFDIAENLRGGAESIVSRLADMGIETTLASGDQPRPVNALATRLGLTAWHAAMLPQDKLQLLRDIQSQQQRVAAVGDGINDSPVLAGADLAIAMGSGTAIAQHSADCVWLGEQLHGLDNTFALARKTMRIVKQNLAWALSYNLLAIPLAVSGNIEPWMAALGMSLSSLIVMLNALRLGSATQPAPSQPKVSSSCCSEPATT